MGIVWENMTPSTELPRDFCAGIGPLWLGIVLVSFNFKFLQILLGKVFDFHVMPHKRLANNVKISGEGIIYTKSPDFTYILNQKSIVTLLYLYWANP